ncbi:MAG: hypothetical protein ACRCUY_11415 [Thermoguttaceae bacterium]
MAGFLPAATFYIDSQNGDDSASGQSPSSAWKTLEKVNQTTFQPGDKLLLKSGCSWSGRLQPLGSGNKEASITLSKYGGEARPIIHGCGLKGGTVSLKDQQYWIISDLEITNKGTDERRKQGIRIENNCAGELSGIVVRNCFVHDVEGILDEYKDGKESGGIVFYITASNFNKPSKWSDILVENNVLTDIAREGILFQSLWIRKKGDVNENMANHGEYVASTNIRIVGNRLERIAGDGIIPWCIKDSVVEQNYVKQSNNNTVKQGHAGIWPYFCENVIFQFNEVCETKTKYDGMAFDFDSSNIDCIYQYNYSHDNEGGFLNCCSDGKSSGNIARYNISQNDGCVDGGRVFLIHGPGNKNYQIYNNTVYVKNGNPPMFHLGADSSESSILFSNNIFINEGTGKFEQLKGCTFVSNLYFGNGVIDSDQKKLVVNPKLVAPNTGGNGLDSVDGYKLRVGSAALKKGKIILSNGGRDYWGNNVSNNTAPNIGAYNGEPIKINEK